MGWHDATRTPSHPPPQGGGVNTRLLLEWLKEYADYMRATGEPWAYIDRVDSARRIIQHREERREGEG